MGALDVGTCSDQGVVTAMRIVLSATTGIVTHMWHGIGVAYCIPLYFTQSHTVVVESPPTGRYCTATYYDHGHVLDQGVVTCVSPIEAFTTRIKTESSNQRSFK